MKPSKLYTKRKTITGTNNTKFLGLKLDKNMTGRTMFKNLYLN